MFEITSDNKDLLYDIRGINDTDTITILANTSKTFIIKIWTPLTGTLFPR